MTQKTNAKESSLLDQFTESGESLIFIQMAKVIQDVGAIGKNQTNTHQGFKFRGIDDLYNACHDAFARHHIFSTQEVLEHLVEEGKTRNGSVNFHHRVLLKIKFHTLDGSSVESVLWGESMDTQDKGMNKAYSIAMKYALIQALMIPTADLEDPDRHTTEVAPRGSQAKPQGNSKPAASKTTQAPAKTTQEAPAAQVDDADLDPTKIICHVGKFNGTRLDQVPANYIWYLAEKWNGRGSQEDQILKAAAQKIHLQIQEEKKASQKPQEPLKDATPVDPIEDPGKPAQPTAPADDDLDDDDIPF